VRPYTTGVLPFATTAMHYNFPNPKRQGEWAELEFSSRGARIGLTILQVYGDSARYDRVTDDRGCLRRVQIKSIANVTGGNENYFSVKLKNLVSQRYRIGEIDFFAILIMPLNTWYIIPVRAARDVDTICLRPNQVTRATRFEKYREAWHLLFNPRRRGLRKLTTPKGFHSKKKRVAQQPAAV
jgi:hypothetical protein